MCQGKHVLEMHRPLLLSNKFLMRKLLVPIHGMCLKPTKDLSCLCMIPCIGYSCNMEPHIDHILGTRDEFQAHSNWPEGMSFQPKGAIGVEVETSEETVKEQSEERENMSDC